MDAEYSELEAEMGVKLYTSSLTQGKYYGRVNTNTSTVGIGTMITELLKNSDLPLSKRTLYMAAGLFKDKTLELLKEGHKVNLFDTVTVYPKISGTITTDSSEDDYRITVGATPSRLARKVVQSANLRIDKYTAAGPEILDTVDANALESGETDETVLHTVRKNAVCTVIGSRLKIGGTDPSVGLYLILELTGDTIKIDSSRISWNKPGKINFTVPDSLTTSAVFKVKIVTQMSGNNAVKEPRSTISDTTITISA